MPTEDLNPPEARPIPAKAAGPSGPRRKTLPLIIIIASALALVILLRWHSGNIQPISQSLPSVAAIKVTRQDMYNEVPIPAEFRPYIQSELHAMVTGYVDKMNVDFGDKVIKGEVLATIKVPELLDELHNAQAKQQQAQADYDNAHLMYNRLLEVSRQKPGLVAQQDIDTALSKDSSAAAAVAAAGADIERYQTLVDYTNIIAPFDGVITQRTADPGALVQAGTGTNNSLPLLRISDNYRLRLDFPVSVDYVQYVHLGDQVTVRVDSLGGKTFTGRITRFSDKVDEETRTMPTEMEMENPNLEIVPGMYAVALFKFEAHPNALSVPIQAISNPQEPVVNVINADNEIEPRPVRLGVEMPDKYEVTDGLREGELVVTSNATQVHPGEKVEPKLIDQSSLPANTPLSAP